MKQHIGDHIHKKMIGHDKLYGTTTLGTRGQVVIPAEARKDLGLKPGDHLVVMGKFGKVLGLIQADQLQSFINTIMKNFSGTGMEKEVMEYMNKFVGNASKFKN
jgi:AbrB family looped-hinge helix DNA binding protein